MDVSDNNGSHTLVAPGASILPGEYAVIGYHVDMAQNGGVNVIAEYGPADLALANSDDEIALSFGGMEIDRVDWAAGWPGSGNGSSMCLKFPYAADNNMSGAWGEAVGTFGANGDSGHPGVASDAMNCP